jgi:hypothetical protein
VCGAQSDKGGNKRWHARGTREFPERVIRKSKQRTRAVRSFLKTKIASRKALLVETIFNLAQAELLGCIVLIVMGGSIPAGSQISPGTLSQAHHSISGFTDCTSCHELSTTKPTYKCLSCHTEIAFRISARSGLHASYNIPAGSSQQCPSCHSEHNGESFSLIKLDVNAFDHSQTGYKLEGKHNGVECHRCHSPARVSERERVSIKVKDLSKTYLGVSQSCTNCHEDKHQGRLGSNCLQCHNFMQWKDIGKFDHSLTRYPLTGMHAEVGCRQCHPLGSDQRPRYTGIAFRECSDCHADPHRGGFVQSCESCHRTTGWKKILAADMNGKFDHSKTKFPLLGKHALVECVQCHADGDFKRSVPFQKCSACHKPDPHGAQFAKRVGGSECSNCHTVDGFKPSTFGVKEHAKSAYPLEGKHASLQCAQCHVPAGKATVYKMKFQYCTDCHDDEHVGQFALAPHFNRCEQCHNVQKFLPSTFILRSHDKTLFSLTGSHIAVPCNDCHKPSLKFKGKQTAQYHWQRLTCTSCHTDPHNGRFNSTTRLFEPKSTTTNCTVCHSTLTWADLSRFDHSKTAFPLSGAHQVVKCGDCHRAANPGDSMMRVDFKRAPTKCEACHVEIHGQQFAKKGVTLCIVCHDSKAWKPSVFDHDKQSSFALQGAHRNVRCESCHKLTRMMGAKTVLFYKPTPTECAACHGPGAIRSALR